MNEPISKITYIFRTATSLSLKVPFLKIKFISTLVCCNILLVYIVEILIFVFKHLIKTTTNLNNTNFCQVITLSLLDSWVNRIANNGLNTSMLSKQTKDKHLKFFHKTHSLNVLLWWFPFAEHRCPIYAYCNVTTVLQTVTTVFQTVYCSLITVSFSCYLRGEIHVHKL